jgi:hypothetical protein
MPQRLLAGVYRAERPDHRAVNFLFESKPVNPGLSFYDALQCRHSKTATIRNSL